MNDDDDDKRVRLWNGLESVLHNGYRLRVRGDLNGWVRDRVSEHITSVFRVPCENNNGKGEW